MPLLIVRHAHAGSRSAWKGDDRERPLSARGRVQAVALVAVFARFGTTRLLSSPYLRCIETLTPSATALGLEVEPTEDLAEGHGAEVVARLAGWGATGGGEAVPVGAGTVAVCTHGDVAVACFGAFGRPGDGIRPTLQKGALWVLDEVDGTLAITEYLQPLAVKD